MLALDAYRRSRLHVITSALVVSTLFLLCAPAGASIGSLPNHVREHINLMLVPFLGSINETPLFAFRGYSLNVIDESRLARNIRISGLLGGAEGLNEEYDSQQGAQGANPSGPIRPLYRHGLAYLQFLVGISISVLAVSIVTRPSRTFGIREFFFCIFWSCVGFAGLLLAALIFGNNPLIP